MGLILDADFGEEGSRRQDRHAIESVELEQVVVAGYDVVGVRSLGAFQHAIVVWVVLDEVHGTGGADEYGHGLKFSSQVSRVGYERAEFFVGKDADEFG